MVVNAVTVDSRPFSPRSGGRGVCEDDDATYEALTSFPGDIPKSGTTVPLLKFLSNEFLRKKQRYLDSGGKYG